MGDFPETINTSFAARQLEYTRQVLFILDDAMTAAEGTPVEAIVRSCINQVQDVIEDME